MGKYRPEKKLHIWILFTQSSIVIFPWHALVYFFSSYLQINSWKFGEFFAINHYPKQLRGTFNKILPKCLGFFGEKNFFWELNNYKDVKTFPCNFWNYSIFRGILRNFLRKELTADSRFCNKLRCLTELWIRL